MDGLSPRYAPISGSRETFYYHWKNYLEHGWNGPEIASRKPDTIHCTPKEIADRILDLRRSTSRSEYAIASQLEREGIAVSHSTVYSILKRNGLIRTLAKPRHKRSFRRFSRRRPNSLWQADLTIFRRRYIIAFMDDCSRFLTAMEWISAPRADLVIDTFDDAIKEYGRPRNILTTTVPSSTL